MSLPRVYTWSLGQSIQLKPKLKKSKVPHSVSVAAAINFCSRLFAVHVSTSPTATKARFPTFHTFSNSET